MNKKCTKNIFTFCRKRCILKYIKQHMSFKKVLSNTRGEAASLVILVSMIVVTLGVLTGSRLIQERVQTSSRASIGPTIIISSIDSSCSAQCQSLGYDFGNCSATNTCTTGSLHSNFMCTSRSACCCGYNPTRTPTPTHTQTNTPTPTATHTPSPTPYQFTMTGYIKYQNSLGAEGIVVKLYKYGAGTNPPRNYHSQVMTDNAGKYVFNVPTGTYDVEPQSNTSVTITPTQQTMSLLAAPFNVTVPLFTASGSPTATTAPVVTNTPVPPTITTTPVITVSPLPTVTSGVIPSVSPIPTGTLSCISLLRSDTGATFKLTLTARNAPNPFYAILQKDGTNILQGVSDNSSTITFTINNPQQGKYKGFISVTQNGFYKSSNTCEYIYGSTTITPSITGNPTITGTPTVTGNPTVTTTVTITPSITRIPTVTASISPTINPSLSVSPSPTRIPVNCPKKSLGDADCQKDRNNVAINILDYAIWYSEFVKNCSSDNLAGCGSDADGNGDPMDANFNYPGTSYISTDTKVSVFDYAVWIQGFITESPITPTNTPPVNTLTPTRIVSGTITPTRTPTPTAGSTTPSPTRIPTATRTPTPNANATPGPHTKVLFDEEIQYTEADNGFHTLKNQGENPLGPLINWQSPKDYYNGIWYFRYKITQADASVATGRMQMCIWNMPGNFPENCAPNITHTGALNNVVTISQSPAQWYKKNETPLNFTNSTPFRIRTVLRGPNGCNVTRHDVAKPCWDQWPNYDTMRVKLTVVMVPVGETFAGWQAYP